MEQPSLGPEDRTCYVCDIRRQDIRPQLAKKPEYERPWFRWLDKVRDNNGNIVYKQPEFVSLQAVLPYPLVGVRPSTTLKLYIYEFRDLKDTFTKFLRDTPPTPENIAPNQHILDEYDLLIPPGDDPRERLVVMTVVIPVPRSLYDDPTYAGPQLVEDICPEIEETAARQVRAYQLARLG